MSAPVTSGNLVDGAATVTWPDRYQYLTVENNNSAGLSITADEPPPRIPAVAAADLATAWYYGSRRQRPARLVAGQWRREPGHADQPRPRLTDRGVFRGGGGLRPSGISGRPDLARAVAASGYGDEPGGEVTRSADELMEEDRQEAQLAKEETERIVCGSTHVGHHRAWRRGRNTATSRAS